MKEQLAQISQSLIEVARTSQTQRLFEALQREDINRRLQIDWTEPSRLVLEKFLKVGYGGVEADWKRFTAQILDFQSRLSSQINQLTQQLRPSIQRLYSTQPAASSKYLHEFLAEALRAYGEIQIEADDSSEEDDEAEHEAVALAQERLSQVFSESTPSRTFRALSQLLAQAKIGPKGREVLLALILCIIGNLLTDPVKGVLGIGDSSNFPRVVKEVRREVKRIQRSEIRIPQAARVVIARELVVRQGPGQKYSAKGRLHAGDLVRVIRTKTMSWSLVEFRDPEHEVLVRGWVYSRYLKSLSGNLPPRTSSGGVDRLRHP